MKAARGEDGVPRPRLLQGPEAPEVLEVVLAQDDEALEGPLRVIGPLGLPTVLLGLSQGGGPPVKLYRSVPEKESESSLVPSRGELTLFPG